MCEASSIDSKVEAALIVTVGTNKLLASSMSVSSSTLLHQQTHFGHAMAASMVAKYHHRHLSAAAHGMFLLHVTESLKDSRDSINHWQCKTRADIAIQQSRVS